MICRCVKLRNSHKGESLFRIAVCRWPRYSPTRVLRKSPWGVNCLVVDKGCLSLALGRPRDVDYCLRTLAEKDEEVDRIGQLVERFLPGARAENEGFSLHRQQLDLSTLRTNLAEQTRPLAEARGLELTTQIAPDLTVDLEPKKENRFSWQRPTLPGACAPSTIGAGGLNCLVRDGTGCFPSAPITTRTCILRVKY